MEVFLVSHTDAVAIRQRWIEGPPLAGCALERLLIAPDRRRALAVVRAESAEAIAQALAERALPSSHHWLAAPIPHTPIILPPRARHVVVERQLSTPVSRPIVEVGMAQQAEHFRNARVAFVTSYLSVDGRTLVSHLMATDPTTVAAVNEAADMVVTAAWEAECIMPAAPAPSTASD